MVPCSSPFHRANWARAQRGILLPLALVLALLAGAFGQPARAATTETRVLPQLQNDAAKRPDTSFRIIVQRVNKDSNAAEKLKALRGTKTKDIPA